jgi:hypothetical protein
LPIAHLVAHPCIVFLEYHRGITASSSILAETGTILTKKEGLIHDEALILAVHYAA